MVVPLLFISGAAALGALGYGAAESAGVSKQLSDVAKFIVPDVIEKPVYQFGQWLGGAGSKVQNIGKNVEGALGNLESATKIFTPSGFTETVAEGVKNAIPTGGIIPQDFKVPSVSDELLKASENFKQFKFEFPTATLPKIDASLPSLNLQALTPQLPEVLTLSTGQQQGESSAPITSILPIALVGFGLAAVLMAVRK